MFIRYARRFRRRYRRLVQILRYRRLTLEGIPILFGQLPAVVDKEEWLVPICKALALGSENRRSNYDIVKFGALPIIWNKSVPAHPWMLDTSYKHQKCKVIFCNIRK